ncbi:zinc finger SWIM domain-containing protein 7 isoform X1 [Electrophorus electricus]|uniref:zinc finger SWIM domain-containing protein 7 isoform X1 n=1 Tax=Electrophorus electricus TaxID=8005 RepID=UPI0015CF8AAB|nr:zinc finger SWIM domain-containing protein 7 isoform X1 [Electrophorus electricus]
MFSRLFSGGTTMASCLSAVAEQLLRDIHREYSEKGQIPDDLLIALRFVFGSCVLHALDLVDRRAVTCVSSPSGRVAFQWTLSGQCDTFPLNAHCAERPWTINANGWTIIRKAMTQKRSFLCFVYHNSGSRLLFLLAWPTQCTSFNRYFEVLPGIFY